MVGLAGVLCGIGHGYAFPIASALVVTRARPSERGAALAAFTALFNLGLLIGGPVLGFVLARSNHGVMFATAAGVALTGVIVFAVWDRRVVSAS
jgi:MFS family permease